MESMKRKKGGKNGKFKINGGKFLKMNGTIYIPDQLSTVA